MMNYSFDPTKYKHFLDILSADEWYLFFELEKFTSIPKPKFREFYEDFKKEVMEDLFDKIFTQAEEDWQEAVLDRLYELKTSPKNAAPSIIGKANEALNAQIPFQLHRFRKDCVNKYKKDSRRRYYRKTKE